MKRSGLGKGLGALFAEYDEEKSTSKEFVMLDAEQLYANPNQPRKNFDEDSLNELAESIKVHGIIQPLIVVERDQRYMIIAGERRYRAAMMVGLSKIPAIIKNYSDAKIQEVSLIENLQREDLNPIETALAIQKLMNDHNYTQEAIAERLGKSRPAIANTLRLLNLPDEVKTLIECGLLSAGHARALITLDDKDTQIKIAKQAVSKQLSVRDVENTVKKLTEEPEKKKEQSAPISEELKELVAVMQRVFATKITAVGNDNKGRIYIDYFTRDDLERIYNEIATLKKIKKL